MEEVLAAKLEAEEWKTPLGPPEKAYPQIAQFYTLPPWTKLARFRLST